IIPTLAALKAAAPSLAVPVLDGLVAGWPQGTSPNIGDTEKRTLDRLMRALPESVRDRLLALAQRWGRTDIFGESISAITDSLKKQVADSSAADPHRIAAAKRLLGLDGKSDVVQMVLQQVNLLTPPGLATGLIGALTESRDRETGRALTAHWAQLTPAVRRAAIAALMRRVEWALALLDAIEKGNISRTDLATEQWSQLKLNPHRGIARRAVRLSAIGGNISSDRQGIGTKLLPLGKRTPRWKYSTRADKNTRFSAKTLGRWRERSSRSCRPDWRRCRRMI